MKAILMAMAAAAICMADDVDDAISKFRSEFRFATKYEKLNLVTDLAKIVDERVLKMLVDEYYWEEEKKSGNQEIIEQILRNAAAYKESEFAGKFFNKVLEKQLEKGQYKFNLSYIKLAMIGMAGLKKEISRQHVAVFNKFIKEAINRRLTEETTIDTLRALAVIRHKSSIQPLIDLMKRVQQDLRTFITNNKKLFEGCDGS